MKIERKKNATRNILWGLIEKVASILLPFITRTVMIHAMGAEYLGLSSLFTSILSVLSISELGFGTAIVFSMYKPIAEDDKVTLCALLNVYRKVYAVIGGLICTVGVIITPFVPYLIKKDCPPELNIYILYLIYLFNTVISYFMYAYKTSLFNAFQRNDLSSKCYASVNLISNILKIVVMLLINNYYVYVIIIPISTIATNIINAYIANREFPDIKPAGNISEDIKKEIKKRIVGLLSFKIYNVVFASVDTIVVSAFLGLIPLASYNNYYYIQSSIVGFLTIFTASITAGIGNKMVTNSVEDNYSDFKKLTFINGWIVSWCAVCLVCLYQPFMAIWAGKELVFPTHTMILMVIYFFIPRVSTMTYTYREAAGLWWEDRFRPIVATVVNLVVNIILVQIIGIDGVIISTLICSIFINIPWGTKVLFENYFKRSAGEYYKRLFFYAFITLVAGLFTHYICSLVSFDGLIKLVIAGCICIIVPNIFFLLFFWKTDEFKYSVSLFKRMLNKNRE